MQKTHEFHSGHMMRKTAGSLNPRQLSIRGHNSMVGQRLVLTTSIQAGLSTTLSTANEAWRKA